MADQLEPKDKLEYLKLMVNEAREVSKSRDSYNKLFLGSVITLHAPIFLYLRQPENNITNLFWVFLCIFLFVLILSVVWSLQITSHKKLNAAKFAEIIRWEKQLFDDEDSFFYNEYQIYQEDTRKDFSSIEKFLPILFPVMDFILTLLIGILLYCNQ